METINRIAVTISFTQKFVDWTNNLPDSELKFTLVSMNEDRPAYLVPPLDELAEAKEWFDSRKQLVLEEAFESICLDEELWPEIESEDTFGEYSDRGISFDGLGSG